MNRTRWAVLFLAMAALVMGAQDGGAVDKRPKSSAVRRALAKRDRAVEQADAAHRKATADADKALLAELKKAKDAALAAKDLDEANAVAALIAETEQAAEPARGGGKGGARPRLAVDMSKGTWVHNGGARGTYRKDGSYRFDVWDVDGQWEALGPHTLLQREPGAGEVTVTVTADGRHALWIYGDGKVGWAKRIE